MIETDLARQIVAQPKIEKSYVDKVLSKEETDKIRELIRKTNLTRSDLLELTYMLGATETKLLNYSEWDRYIHLKYVIWICEFVKVAELLFDYEDDLKAQEAKCKTDGVKFEITANTKKLLENSKRLMEHNFKFLIDLYFNIARTSLSIGATGLLEILRNKYEITYPLGMGDSGIVQSSPQKKGFFKFGK